MIIDLQRRIQEIGRIRIGKQVPAGKGKRPAKLTTFRLTSRDKTPITAAAGLYGGTVEEWPEAPGGLQWQVETETASLNVVVPPSDMALSQYYELWSGGGCLRRCTGAIEPDVDWERAESVSGGPCLCDPEKRECAIHTRLSVMLADLPGLGVWRLDSQGYNAAVELLGQVSTIEIAAQRGIMLPARLRLDQRVQKRPGQATRRFAVPMLELFVTPAQALRGELGGIDGRTPGTLSIEPRPISEAPDYEGGEPVPGEPVVMVPVEDYPAHQARARGKVTPVPESVPEHPVAPIAEQAKARRQPKQRGQQPVPATGLAPRTAEQAKRGGGALVPTGTVERTTTVHLPGDDDDGELAEHRLAMAEAEAEREGPTEAERRAMVEAERQAEAEHEGEPGGWVVEHDDGTPSGDDRAPGPGQEALPLNGPKTAPQLPAEPQTARPAGDRMGKPPGETDPWAAQADAEGDPWGPAPAPAKPVRQPPPENAGVNIPAKVEQNRLMHKLFREAGLTDRQDRLIVTSHILGHEVATSGVLTYGEAHELISTLEAWRDDPDTDVDATVTEILHTWVMAQANAAEQAEQGEEGS